MGAISISGIVEKIEEVVDLPVTIVNLKLFDEDVERKRVLVYLVLEKSMEGRNIDIVTEFGESVRQSVIGYDFAECREFDRESVLEFWDVLKKRGYKFNI